MKGKLSFRPIRPGDMDFLHRLYGSTREEELLCLDWSREQKDDFIRMQFDTQHKYYQENYKEAQFLVILIGKKKAGRLYLDRRSDDIRIVDIALLPEFRGKKTGSKILADILSEGEEKGITVSIHVEQFNRAIALYERFGFKRIDQRGVYYLMEWNPPKNEPKRLNDIETS